MSDLTAKLREEYPADFQGCDPSFDLRQSAADKIERLEARIVSLKCFARTLAIHVEGHFVMPTDSSASVCKKWAQNVIEQHKDDNG